MQEGISTQGHDESARPNEAPQSDGIRLSPAEVAAQRDELLQSGIDVDDVLWGMRSEDVGRSIPELLAHGATVESIVTAMGRGWVDMHGLSRLIEAGVPALELLPLLTTRHKVRYFDSLVEAGATTEEIVGNFTTSEIAANVAELKERGLPNVDLLFDKCEPRAVVANLPDLRRAGVVINFDRYLPMLTAEDIGANLAALLEAGAPVDVLLQAMDPWDIQDAKEVLLSSGATPNEVQRRLPRGWSETLKPAAQVNRDTPVESSEIAA